MNRDDLIASMSSLSGYPPGSRTVQAFVSVAEDYADSSGQQPWRWSDEPGDDGYERVWTCCGGPYDEAPAGHYADCPTDTSGQATWRVGRHFPIHVYEGDEPIATFHRAEDAARAVAAVNDDTSERRACDIVVEVYDGVSVSMKCVTCRERIAVRPERAAAEMSELTHLAGEHIRAAVAGPPARPRRGGQAVTAASGADQPTPDLMANLRRSLERASIARGICPRSNQPIMPGGSLRPSCSFCDCGDPEEAR